MRSARLLITISTSFFLMSLELFAFSMHGALPPSDPHEGPIVFSPIPESPEIITAKAALEKARLELAKLPVNNEADINVLVAQLIKELSDAPTFKVNGDFTVLHAKEVSRFLLLYLAAIMHIDQKEHEMDISKSRLDFFLESVNRVLHVRKVVVTSKPGLSNKVKEFDDLWIGFPADALRMYFFLTTTYFSDDIKSGMVMRIITAITENHRMLYQSVKQFGLPIYSKVTAALPSCLTDSFECQ